MVISECARWLFAFGVMTSMTDMVEKSCLRCQEFEELGLEDGAPDKKAIKI